MGILPRHENMIAVLAVDEVKVKRIDDDTHVNWIAVNGGIIEIANNVITILLTQLNVRAILMLVVQNVLNFVQNVKSKKHKTNT